MRYKSAWIINVIVDELSLLGGPQSQVTHVLDSVHPLSDNRKYSPNLCVSRFVPVIYINESCRLS